MGVNLIVEHAATHEAAMATSTQAVLSQAENIKEAASPNDRIERNRETNGLKTMLSTSRNKVGVKLLSNLLDNLSAMGFKPQTLSGEKVTAKNQLNPENFQWGEATRAEDTVDIQNPITRIETSPHKKNRERNLNPQLAEQPVVLDEEGQRAAAQYPATYAESLVSNSPELKKKLEQMEGVLEEQGISSRELKGLQKSVASSVRTEITKQVRDAYLQKFVSKEKTLEFIMGKRQLNDVINSAFENPKLGGADFGGDHLDGLQGAAKDEAAKARAEVKEYVKEKIEKELIENHLKPKDNQKEIKELLTLGAKAGLNLNELGKEIAKQKEDLGLNYFAAPNQQNFADSGQGHPGQNQNANTEDSVFDDDDKKEFFINALRSLFMQRVLKGDLQTRLQTSFKMRKLKNEVVRLGVTIEDIDKIEKEGVALARVQTLQMLREFLLERASFYQLSGPAYALNERKVKSTLSNLERLGFHLTENEQKNMVDDANREVYQQVAGELAEIEAALKLQSHPGLEMKRPLLMKIAARIQEETKISNPVTISPRVAEYTLRGASNLKIISEAA